MSSAMAASGKFSACLFLFFAYLLSLIFIWSQYGPKHRLKVESLFSATNQLFRNQDDQLSPAIVLVDSKGRLTIRVKSFNYVLDSLRVWTWRQRGNGRAWNWRGQKYSIHMSLNVLIGSADNHKYIDWLASNHSHTVKTVVLPWLKLPSSVAEDKLKNDVNVIIQSYYQWSADDRLCRWIEKPGTKQQSKSDVTSNEKCERNMGSTVTVTPTSRNITAHWLSNGELNLPEGFTTTPPYVFHLHLYQDAIVTSVGDVIVGNTKMVVQTCRYDTSTRLPSDSRLWNTSIYDELYVISQYWGDGVFHRMVEVVPRLAVGLEFLQQNSHIRIHALETSPNGRLAELMTIFRLDPARLVSGIVKAKIVYQPRATLCGSANAVESQLVSQLYAEHIQREWPSVAESPPHRLVLIKRTKTRQFVQQDAIEKVIQKVAADFNLTYTLFSDDPTPSLNITMKWFYGAAMVVGPHGAGLSNMYFSRPTTYVVEGVCNVPHVNMCFKDLSHVLGHRWHGVMSTGGCRSVVTVSPDDIESAVRKQLVLREKSQNVLNSFV